MNRVALLGTGYIGRKLIASLKNKGLTIRVSTTTPEKVQDLEKIADEVFLVKGNDLHGMERFLKDVVLDITEEHIHMLPLESVTDIIADSLEHVDIDLLVRHITKVFSQAATVWKALPIPSREIDVAIKQELPAKV